MEQENAWDDYQRGQLRRLNDGVAAWNEWRLDLANRTLRPFSTCLLRGVNLAGRDLRAANFSFGDLAGTSFKGADLRGATFHGSSVKDADFSNANLESADLSDCHLENASFIYARLKKANLRNAKLMGVVFRRTDLSGVMLHGAICGETIFSDVDLSSADGLDEIVHSMASTIGIDVIFRTRLLPEEFLVGCGITDALIKNIPAIVASEEPIQFYSCFISYSHKDEEFAKRLFSRLRDEKLRVWYAPEDMKLGQKIHEQIESAIRVHDKLLLVLSEASMNSEWVKTEIAHARQREVKEGKRVLFPISLVPFDAIRGWKAFDADTGKDMAREIREYLIGDFSDWKDHDSFEKGFERLLKDLRAEAAKEPAKGS